MLRIMPPSPRGARGERISAARVRRGARGDRRRARNQSVLGRLVSKLVLWKYSNGSS